MKNILIIEDERTVAELERDYLEINSLKVSIEETGDGGLKRILKNDIDLVILDLMLPDMDGFEVCRKIRRRTDIPILIVSAKKSDIDKIRGLGIGADDYITKPFSPNELVARVKAHLNRYIRLTRKRSDENEYIEYPGLKIDRTAVGFLLMGKKDASQQRSLIYLLILLRIRIMYFLKTSYLVPYGEWIPWVRLQR